MISTNCNGVNIHIGDLLRVHTKVVEGVKTRIQVFEGILIRLKGRGENEQSSFSNEQSSFSNKTFTVRKIGAGGIGVERIWPLDSRSIVKIEVKKKTTGVRRSKLYYLRDLTGKSAVRV